MGKFRIVIDKGLCQGHSVCVAEAPELFRVIDTDLAYPQSEAIQEAPPPALLAKAEAAAEYCPNGAITIIYEDD
jgi:sterol 14-demethylase